LIYLKLIKTSMIETDYLILSVVICTYNRASLLRLAVESVFVQEISPDCYELIVVDNASTDATSEVVEQLFAGRKNMRYVFEKEQGLSYARNRGWREARGDYVIYIDDECLLPSGYLEAAVRIIQLHNPEIFGGQIKSFYDFKKPEWVKDEYYSDFLDRKTGVLSHSEYVYGGNMGIRRDTLRRVGGFNTNLGMKANELSFAEEVEFQQRTIESIPDLKVYFDSNLWLYHHVRKEKVNLKWILKFHFSLGLKGLEGFNAIKAYKSMPVHRKMIRIMEIIVGISYRIIRICARLFILVFWRNENYPYWQQYLVERIFGIEVKKIGVYYAEIGYILLSLRKKDAHG
jgi:glycosyltransferase involved in cell wall biosynthesis